MIIEHVRNLLEEDVWIYGTSGALLKLPSEPIRPLELGYNHRLTEPPKNGMYYITDNSTKPMLEKDWRYFGHIAKVSYIGSGLHGEQIYSLWDLIGNRLEIVSDNARPVGNGFDFGESKKAEAEIRLKYRRFPSGANFTTEICL